tara:strand:- start:306 stop:899 length:594 start_codon:yes stop_codon:yes gene_type:complete
MRIIFSIIIVIFNIQSWTNADDIRDFEIEGMSIGDSLLNFMSEKQIKEALGSEKAYFYENKFVTISSWDNRDKYETYDNVGIILKQDDSTYKIYGLEGLLINQDGNIDDCYKKQESIAKEILIVTGDKYNLKRWFLEKNRKTKEQLAVKYIDFEIIDSDRRPISIVCFDINRNGDKYTRLVVAVDSEEFDKYLDTVY